MNKFEATFQITVSDYRMASYYGLAMRQHKILRVLIFMVGAAFLFFCTSNMWANGMELAILLLMICAVWLLMMFANMEKGIRQYVKHENTMIGCEYHMTLESHRIQIRVPERKVNVSVKMNDLTAVFELSKAFMIYTSMQDAYILPFRCLTKEQKEALRENFRKFLGDRFSESKLLIGKRRR